MRDLDKIEDLPVSGWVYFNQGLTVDKCMSGWLQTSAAHNSNGR